MSWFDTIFAVLSDPTPSGHHAFVEDCFTAYRLAWLESKVSDDESVRLLTDQLDKFDTFRDGNGTIHYPQMLLDCWHDGATPASARKRLSSY